MAAGDAETLTKEIADLAREQLAQQRRSRLDVRKVTWDEASISVSFGTNMLGLTTEYRSNGEKLGPFHVDQVNLFEPLRELHSLLEFSSEDKIAGLTIAFTKSDSSLTVGL